MFVSFQISVNVCEETKSKPRQQPTAQPSPSPALPADPATWANTVTQSKAESHDRVSLAPFKNTQNPERSWDCFKKVLSRNEATLRAQRFGFFAVVVDVPHWDQLLPGKIIGFRALGFRVLGLGFRV